jgi:hypothetical protein
MTAILVATVSCWHLIRGRKQAACLAPQKASAATYVLLRLGASSNQTTADQRTSGTATEKTLRSELLRLVATGEGDSVTIHCLLTLVGRVSS